MFSKNKIIIIVVLKFVLSLYISKISLKTKICICTLGKNENKYIREFVIFYKKIGVDKIYIYDNNNINGERFDYSIKDYIQIGFVQVINWRGKKLPQLKIMNNCYQKYYKKYDWFIFYDIDEYIHLKDYSNIKYFLNEKKFYKCQLIYLNLLPHTDNNKLYYENRSLFERFPELVPKNKPEGQLLEIKFILKGHIKKVRIKSQHYCNNKLKNCNGFGKTNTNRRIYTREPDYKYYYIDHFYSKSTEELIEKINKGDCRFKNSMIMNKIERYFNQSSHNKEKINLIEKRLGVNLSKYKAIQ